MQRSIDIADTKPFTLPHGTYRVVGVNQIEGEWFASVKNLDTGEYKEKPWSWVEAVNKKLNG